MPVNPKPLPCLAILDECFSYDQFTGTLSWRRRPRSHFKSDRECNRWNSRHAGKKAGSRTAHGHLQLRLNGQECYVHRVVWALFYRSEPTGYIDHINGVSDDNRISNMRDVTHYVNMQNTRMRKKTKTNIMCVSHHTTGSWQAMIGVNGKKIYLGSFKSAHEAERAVRKAKKEHGAANVEGA